MLTQFPFMCCGHDHNTDKYHLVCLSWTKRRGVTEKDKATKAAKTTKTIRTYVANSSHVDIGEGNNRQDDDIERIILDMLPEQEERNIEKERRENEKKEMERRDKERREKERREKERREKERREKERRERDRREKDKEQEENENDESESEEEIPVQFGAMTNQLQICNWFGLTSKCTTSGKQNA
ncbi:protein split ends isoform X5 [Rhizophagus clarus]|uniref:Protein split ends isoform X5 n=1 Tax=Rhizophagus clarus TaxID=94130 RepID=A0A8H3LL42_9GLOM|nr:protein split ends isoform X5 [Rhizophagus clarus]